MSVGPVVAKTLVSHDVVATLEIVVLVRVDPGLPRFLALTRSSALPLHLRDWSFEVTFLGDFWFLRTEKL